MGQHHQILIIGGGNAGISAAAQLLRKRSNLEIAIIEPSDRHFYQPAWTLVGGGVFNIHDTIRSEASVIPKGVTWIREAAASFQPEQNQVTTNTGATYTYDYLIVAPGIQLNWHLIEGLKETLGKNGVTTNYSVDYAAYPFECLRQLKAGQTALFTSPGTAVKCGGAPQKIMYLAADYLRKNGLQGKATVEFVTAGSVIFAIKEYAEQLMKKVNEYGIKLNFKHDLVAIDGPNKQATFKVTDAEGVTHMVQKHFDMIHVVPPMSAPDFIKSSPLANEAGWVEVDKYTLQHTRYANVFGLGDAMSAPNSKTGAAVRKQVPVMVKNMLALMDGQAMPGKYSGYGSCPLVVGYGKLILAEFGYDNVRMETFPFDQSKPRWSMWMLKRYVLPWLYWNKILKGTA